jgi:hypothetical protein
MHGVAPHMCDQVARSLLGGGAGGRSPGLLSRDTSASPECHCIAVAFGIEPFHPSHPRTQIPGSVKFGTSPRPTDLEGLTGFSLRAPNAFVGEVHDRMPVLLAERDFEPWLSGAAGVELLKPAPDDMLQRWPVSKRVNSSRALIEPIELATAGA